MRVLHMGVALWIVPVQFQNAFQFLGITSATYPVIRQTPDALAQV